MHRATGNVKDKFEERRGEARAQMQREAPQLFHGRVGDQRTEDEGLSGLQEAGENGPG